MGSIEPRPQGIEDLMSKIPDGEPVVMINLLRYREQADYASQAEAEPCSGREAYGRYGQAVFPLLGKVGARAIFAGAVASTLIAPEGELWDDAVLVQYPSTGAFVAMTSSPEYRAISFHRTAGLADSRLIAVPAPQPG